MYSIPRNRKLEAWAYLVGFTLVAVPGTLLLLSTGKQVANTTLAGLFIAEFAGAEVMRSAYKFRLKRANKHEFR